MPLPARPNDMMCLALWTGQRAQGFGGELPAPDLCKSTIAPSYRPGTSRHGRPRPSDLALENPQQSRIKKFLTLSPNILILNDKVRLSVVDAILP